MQGENLQLISPPNKYSSVPKPITIASLLTHLFIQKITKPTNGFLIQASQINFTLSQATFIYLLPFSATIIIFTHSISQIKHFIIIIIKYSIKLSTNLLKVAYLIFLYPFLILFITEVPFFLKITPFIIFTVIIIIFIAFI